MELIYNQNDIPRRQWRYGLRSSAKTGCGWVAAYNAMTLLGRAVDIPRLIRQFEHQFPLVHGNAGTFIASPALLLKRYGFQTRMLSGRKQFDTFAKEYPVCILFYYWRDKWRVGSHFVCLRWDGSEFIGYNTFKNSTGPDHYGPSLQDFLKRRRYFGCVLTGVKPKK